MERGREERERNSYIQKTSATLVQYTVRRMLKINLVICPSLSNRTFIKRPPTFSADIRNVLPHLFPRYVTQPSFWRNKHSHPGHNWAVPGTGINSCFTESELKLDSAPEMICVKSKEKMDIPTGFRAQRHDANGKRDGNRRWNNAKRGSRFTKSIWNRFLMQSSTYPRWTNQPSTASELQP